jgi:hypothetical protein
VKFEDLADIRDQLADPSAHVARGAVPGLIPEGLSLLYGHSGSGKSFAAIGIAARIAVGASIAGIPIGRADVAYVATEDLHGIRRRALAMADALGAGRSANLYVSSGPDVPSHAENFAHAFFDAFDRAWFSPSLIVIDTLGATFLGETANDDRAATAASTQFLKIASRMRCSVLVVHHSGKDAERGMRGSRVLQDRADAVFRVERTSIGAALTVEKMRNGASGGRIDVTLTPYMFEPAPSVRIETLIATDFSRAEDVPGTADRRLAADARSALQVLERLLAVPDSGRNVSLEVWRTETLKKLGKSNAVTGRTAFFKAKKALFAAKLIVETQDGITVPDGSRRNGNAPGVLDTEGVPRSPSVGRGERGNDRPSTSEDPENENHDD